MARNILLIKSSIPAITEAASSVNATGKQPINQNVSMLLLFR